MSGESCAFLNCSSSVLAGTNDASFQLTTWVAGQMIVWVKSTGQYSVEMINILPTGVQALAIVVGITVPSFVMSAPGPSPISLN